MSSNPKRVHSIVLDALALKEEDRDAFVRSSCTGDTELLVEVMSSLRSVELSTSKVSAGSGGDADVEDSGSGATQAPAIGSRFGDLTLVSKLGAGQQGTVFEAYQGTLDRHVAVKILTSGAGDSTEQADRFRREAEAAGRLNHPNIVAIHEILERQGSLMIVQELVVGQTLEDILLEREKQSGTISGAECQWAAEICMQLARGLAHAHEHQVIHRDVKPANVLVTNEGVPKLTDFGLALMQDRFGLTQTGTLLGTPKYMAPEQVESSHDDLDARTDVYALGSILYRMLTGHVPFTARTIQALFRDILTRAPKSPRSMHLAVPRDLEAVCLKCLEKDKEARYASAGELADDLQSYLAGQSTVARPLGLIGSTDRAMRRLAVSTLAAVSLLFPVVWFALDVAWLSPWAERTPSVHDYRLGLLAVFLLCTVWPVARLFRRMAHGRRVATAACISLVLLAGSLGFWSVREDAQRQQHGLAREALEVQLSTSADPSMDALKTYEADWAERFGPRDWQLMARGYLLAKRAPLAIRWVDKLTAQDRDNPVGMAFAYVLADLFGSSSDAAAVEQRLWATENDVNDWEQWKHAGQILSDVRRFDRAQRAYDIALDDSTVPWHLLSPDLAQVSLALCQYQRADDDLRVTLDRLPNDPVLQYQLFHIACRTAMGLGHWEDAENYLARFESLEGVSREVVLSLRFRLLQRQGRFDDASALVNEIASATGATASELSWSGTTAASMADAALAAGKLSARDEALDLGQDCFERLLQMNPNSVEAHVQLASGLLRMAESIPEPDEKRAILTKAEGLAERAVDLDDDYYRAHANLAFARRELALLDFPDYEGITAPALHRFLNPMRKALERDTLEPQLLNDAAYGLTLLYELEPDPSLLTEALDNIRRSIRLWEGTEASLCGVMPYLNYVYDTQRSINETLGDLPAALLSARRAVATAEDVGADPNRTAGLSEHVQRLEALIEKR